MGSILQDLRYAVRALRKSPGFSAVAIATLALGIGATVAVFSVVNGVLLAPLPYRQPDRLVAVHHFYPSLDLTASVSVPGFRDYRARTDIFQSAGVATGRPMNLTGVGEPVRVTSIGVAGDFFQTLGVAPALGRTLRADESEAGKNQVVVLTWNFFQRQFGGDSSIVGTSITLDNHAYQVVGVMPASYRDYFSSSADLYTPLVFKPADFADSRRTNEYLAFFGRLAPGVTPEAAQEKLHLYAVQLRTTYTNAYPSDWDLKVVPLAKEASQNIRTGLLLLLGAVGLVLLIACANVANLLLARLASRARDVAVRVAIGASPARLARLMICESVVLATVGGGLGVLLATWGVPALLTLNGGSLPATAQVRVNLPVLGFALGASILTGLIFGAFPALRTARTDLHETLKEGGRAIGDRGGLRLRRSLVVSTVALALTLLVGAGLLMRSFERVVNVDPGFQPDRLLTFRLSLPSTKYANDTVRSAALERLGEELAAAPGIQAAGGTSTLPFSGGFSTASFNVEGYQPPPKMPSPWGDMRVVTTGFLPAIGATLIAGRQFTPGDRAGTPPVCIVDDEMVHRYWPNDNPIGKRITFNNPTDSSITWITVVGVVRHLADNGLDENSRLQVYFPVAQAGQSAMSFVVRTAGEPTAATNVVRAAVHTVDPDLPLSNVASMESLIGDSLGARRFAMVLLGGFAALAILLASIGLYGVMSYTVTQRVRELGVRLALGAERGAVLGLVLRQGALLALAGVAIGLVAALGLTRLMQGMLYDVGATDPLTFGGTALILIGVALTASYFPARRATRIDPLEALRDE